MAYPSGTLCKMFYNSIKKKIVSKKVENKRIFQYKKKSVLL